LDITQTALTAGSVCFNYVIVAAPGRQDRQVTAGAKQYVSLVSGHLMYAMDSPSK